MTELSVVMPVYNEAPIIGGIVADVTRRILDVVGDTELVMVDDRGTDGSSAILAELVALDPRYRLVVNPVNRGHGPSVLAGMAAATGTWILQLDSDGQVDLDVFAELWARRDSFDLAAGVRVDRQDVWHRRTLSKVVNTLASILARHRVADANAPFKLVRRSLVEHLEIPPTTFAPSILLVIGALRSGARVEPVAVEHLPRQGGESSLRVGRLARAVARATPQTIRGGMRRVERYGESQRTSTS
jgi:dolichol-phosphate mannosyltransferase